MDGELLVPDAIEPVSVRFASLDEAAIVREVMLAAYAELAGALPVDSGAHTETVDEVSAYMRRGGAVLAELAGEPVGSARFLPDDGYLYVGRLAVLPSHRRLGVASGIMRFMEDVARRHGLSTIRVGVRDSLPSNVGLYDSLGYETISIEPHPRGPDRVWTMIKTIPRST